MEEVSAAPPAPPARGFAVFDALRVPSFRSYWVGMFTYVLGWNIEYVTFAWLVWELKHDPLILGYLGLAQGVPLVLFQVFGGVLADRTERLRLLIGTQFVTGTILTIAFVLTATGLVTVEHLLLLSVVSGTFRAFEQPSRMALIPQLVDRDRMLNAIALGSFAWQVGRILGPAIAGTLIALFGPAVGFALAALSYYFAIGLYSRIRIPTETRLDTGHSVFQTLAEGFSYIARTSPASILIAVTFFDSVFGMSYVTLLPVFADDYLAAGSSGYGLMQAATGVGAIAGVLTIASIAHRLRRRGTTLLIGSACFGLALVIFSRSPVLLFAAVMLAVMGFCNTFYLTQVSVLLQEHVPNRLRGRVMGIYGLTYNLVPIGGVLAGGLAALMDARFAVMLGGAMVLAQALFVAAFTRLRTVR